MVRRYEAEKRQNSLGDGMSMHRAVVLEFSLRVGIPSSFSKTSLIYLLVSKSPNAIIRGII